MSLLFYRTHSNLPFFTQGLLNVGVDTEEKTGERRDIEI